MNVKRVVEKEKWVLMTTGLAIVSSLFSSYIKGYFGIDTGNVEQVNAKVELNIFYLIVPLLIAPVIEEWIFRKFLPLGIGTLFERINRTIAIIISNGIFAAVHFDWFFFPYFVNGCLYAWSYEKTRDIKVPIVAHVIFNSFVFLATTF
ncbi:CPBP family glutamic-type intramembrane protease [Bacillus cereus]|uniref:CPBP family glutamic-type intramembrane protease n=1 Tax=Bacillus cereus TaxID=1396 RepID=UPI00144423C3|nr:CPBP family intramembrane metalloprotease [Bacillus cereus]